MGVILELGKVASVIFLHKNWHSPFLVKTYLVISILILMFVNSIGIFGFLSNAHIQQEIINNSQTSQIEIIQSKIENENSIIKDIDSQILQIDNSLAKLIQQGKVLTSIQQGSIQKKTRDSLLDEKNKHMEIIENLKINKINTDNSNAVIDSRFGPLLYISKMFFGNSNKEQLEETVRYIISIIIFVFDPLALVLLIASQFSFSQIKKKNLFIPRKDDTFTFDDKILE
jgi:hypothetical protein